MLFIKPNNTIRINGSVMYNMGKYVIARLSNGFLCFLYSCMISAKKSIGINIAMLSMGSLCFADINAIKNIIIEIDIPNKYCGYSPNFLPIL